MTAAPAGAGDVSAGPGAVTASELAFAIAVSDRGVDVEAVVPAGSTMAIVGPNGSGKSTVLGALAGLVGPDAGWCRLGAQTLFDCRGHRGAVLPPHRRRVALLGQQTLLFPHLDVLDNVAFGPRSGGLSRRRAREQAQRWLVELGADSWSRARPQELSGGQARRVALARALAAQPELLLLDEPLAALDTSVAAELRPLLRRLLAQRTTLIVTHDVVDVATLADRVMVLAAGRVAETGDVQQMLNRPTSTFAADMFGWNLLIGTAVSSTEVRIADGTVVTGVARQGLAVRERAAVAFRPASVTVHLAPPEGSARNVMAGVVDSVVDLGATVRVTVGLVSADVTGASVAELGLVAGTRVFMSVKATSVDVYPA